MKQYITIVTNIQIFFHLNCIAKSTTKNHKNNYPNHDKFQSIKCKEKSDLHKHFICFFLKKLYDYI